MSITGMNLVDMSIIKNAFHLFVAYNLKYSSTIVSDYKITDEEILEMVDSAHYLEILQ